MGLIALAPRVSGSLAMKLLDQDRRQHAMTAMMTAACIFTFLLVSIGSSRLGPYQDTPLFLAEARRSAGQTDVHIGTFDYFEPSVVFYAGRDVTKLNTPRDVADFLTAHPKSFVITRATRFNELREVLPISANPISRRRNFLHGYELILIGL